MTALRSVLRDLAAGYMWLGIICGPIGFAWFAVRYPWLPVGLTWFAIVLVALGCAIGAAAPLEFRGLGLSILSFVIAAGVVVTSIHVADSSTDGAAHTVISIAVASVTLFAVRARSAVEVRRQSSELLEQVVLLHTKSDAMSGDRRRCPRRHVWGWREASVLVLAFLAVRRTRTR